MGLKRRGEHPPYRYPASKPTIVDEALMDKIEQTTTAADHEHEWRDTGFATVEDCECGATRSGDIVIPADVSPPERR